MRERSVAAAFTAVGFLLGACAPLQPAEISRERAIEIARPQVTFTVMSVEAVKALSNGQPIWRITFRGRLPGQPPLLFETRIVEVDRRTGQLVSVART